MSESAEEFKLIEIGSFRHLKLRAILLESIKLERMSVNDLDAIALRLGYEPGTRRYKSALNMLEGLLFVSDKLVHRLVDFHVEALARFCHRLVRWETGSPFKAVCETELTYQGSVDQLMADISCNGTPVG